MSKISSVIDELTTYLIKFIPIIVESIKKSKIFLNRNDNEAITNLNLAKTWLSDALLSNKKESKDKLYYSALSHLKIAYNIITIDEYKAQIICYISGCYLYFNELELFQKYLNEYKTQYLYVKLPSEFVIFMNELGKKEALLKSSNSRQKLITEKRLIKPDKTRNNDLRKASNKKNKTNINNNQKKPMSNSTIQGSGIKGHSGRVY